MDSENSIFFFFVLYSKIINLDLTKKSNDKIFSLNFSLFLKPQLSHMWIE